VLVSLLLLVVKAAAFFHQHGDGGCAWIFAHYEVRTNFSVQRTENWALAHLLHVVFVVDVVELPCVLPWHVVLLDMSKKIPCCVSCNIQGSAPDERCLLFPGSHDDLFLFSAEDFNLAAIAGSESMRKALDDISATITDPQERAEWCVLVKLSSRPRLVHKPLQPGSIDFRAFPVALPFVSLILYILNYSVIGGKRRETDSRSSTTSSSALALIPFAGTRFGNRTFL